MANSVRSQDEAEEVHKPFLELPLEVRLLIYKHLFSHLTLPLALPLFDNSSCSILRTSRRISQEAVSMFFDLATFHVDSGELLQLTYSSSPAPRCTHRCRIRNISFSQIMEDFVVLHPPDDTSWRPSLYFPNLRHVTIVQEFCAASTNHHADNRWCECTRLRGGAQDVDNDENAVARNAAMLRRILPWMRAEKSYEVAIYIRFLDDEMNKKRQVCAIMVKADNVTVVDGDSTVDRVEEFAYLLREHLHAKVTAD